MTAVIRLAILTLALAFTVGARSAPDIGHSSGKQLEPDSEKGAHVYNTRCSLCHGNQGMGEGALPIRIDAYPKTSLTQAVQAQSRQAIREVIAFGGTLDGVSQYMPPYSHELTWVELESVALFVELLRSDKDRALALLQEAGGHLEPSQRVGEQIFRERCVLCHGRHGEGDGRMAKILTSPPPADLTASRLPDDYLNTIITRGGEGVGRSKHMPPWGEQLNQAEIDSVILHIKSIRD